MLLSFVFSQSVELWEIQGSGNSSSFVGQNVDTEDNIITAVGNVFFVMQTPTSRSDNDLLTNHTFTLPVDEQYSYVYLGTANALDQCMTTDLSSLTVTEFAYVRGNAGIAEANEENPNHTLRSSDHDGFVIYLEMDMPVSTEDEILASKLYLNYPNPITNHNRIIVDNAVGEVEFQIWNKIGQVVWQTKGFMTELKMPSLTAGTYFFIVKDEKSSITEKVNFVR